MVGAFTLPETNFLHLKIGHPTRKLVFQPSIFRGYVSFREGNGDESHGRNRTKKSPKKQTKEKWS